MRRRRDDAKTETWETSASVAAHRWRHLTDSDVNRLIGEARRFDTTRRWEGLDGLVVGSEMRAMISATASLLSVNIGERVFSDVATVIIAPRSAVRRAHQDAGGSLISEGVVDILGESAMHGPVRLAWDTVVEELASGSRTSVIIHEFAHKVDMSDGYANGVPPIRDHEAALRFRNTAAAVLDQLRSEATPSPLRSYAAVNESELFAVASEAFFLDASAMRSHHEDLYREMAGFYRQDPARIVRP
ncbi:MAG: M90 family metallopeptidase [Acidimicrobiia bacterium]